MAQSDLDLSKKSVSQWANLIDEWVYSDRDRCLLKRRLLDGICYEPLAEEFELSVSQVKRICRRGVDTILKHI